MTIDWATVGNPGNDCETQSQGCFGAVAKTYRIAKSEVTNAQYTEFLNAVAVTDTNGLYNSNMGSGFGGITQSCSPSCTYSVSSGRGNMPVNFVSFYDALRFANWMHNGQPMGAQGNATTEDGAYTITTQGITNNSITRNVGATIFLTSEDEWYKAAYHNAIGLSASDYFNYPAGSDAQTACTAPTSGANSANCDASGSDSTDADLDDLTVVGSFTGSASPYGTFDQGGNVWEWNEAIISGSLRGVRGASFGNGAINLTAAARNTLNPTSENPDVGFRIASIPEPGTALLVSTGLLILAGCGRRRE